MEERCVCAPLNCQPVPLVGLSAGALYDALHKHPAAREFAELEQRLLTSPGSAVVAQEPGGLCQHWAMFAPETDAASNNDKMLAFRREEIDDLENNVLHAWHLCGNHQTSLVDGAAVMLQGLSRVAFFDIAGWLVRSWCLLGPSSGGDRASRRRPLSRRPWCPSRLGRRVLS